MNILYVLNSGKPGGMEQHVLDLVEGMVGEGHSVWVWCGPGDFASKFEQAGASVKVKSIKLDLDAFYVLSLARFMRSNKIDLVHSHELKAVVNSMLAAFLSDVPLRVSHTHTPISEWQISSWKKRLNILVYRFIVNHFSGVEVALTESRQRVKASEGISEKKLRVIPNGIDVSRFTLSDEQKTKYRQDVLSRYGFPGDTYLFGNISRTTEEKGHEVLIEAYEVFKQLVRARGLEDRSKLLIAGGGSLEDSLRDRISDLGLSGDVVITGRFDSLDLVKFYGSFDSFVFPSLAEGFGIVLIEAMASALPIVCSDLEVFQEVGGSTVRYFETAWPRRCWIYILGKISMRVLAKLPVGASQSFIPKKLLFLSTAICIWI
jgi:glycosyltransferase involved in cell wall biosynthesis